MHRRLSNIASERKRVTQIKSISALSITCLCLCPCPYDRMLPHEGGACHTRLALGQGQKRREEERKGVACAAFPLAVYIVKWLGSKIVREIVLKFVWMMINVA